MESTQLPTVNMKRKNIIFLDITWVDGGNVAADDKDHISNYCFKRERRFRRWRCKT
jgi:hypothetical protein